MTSHKALPHDIVRCIYDNLAAEKTSLCNCSLVCRSWNFPAASYLFHRVSLRQPPTEGKDPCETLLDAIEHSQRMKYGIVELNLDGDKTFSSEDCRRFFKRRLIAANALQRLLASLPHLRVVQMHAFDIVGPFVMEIPKTTIHRLTIWDDPLGTVCNEVALARMLSLFDRCDILCIRLKFSSFTQSISMERHTNSRLSVKHLELDLKNAVVPGVVQILQASLEPSALESINVAGTGEFETSDTVFSTLLGARRALNTIPSKFEYELSHASRLSNRYSAPKAFR